MPPPTGPNDSPGLGGFFAPYAFRYGSVSHHTSAAGEVGACDKTTIRVGRRMNGNHAAATNARGNTASLPTGEAFDSLRARTPPVECDSLGGSLERLDRLEPRL